MKEYGTIIQEMIVISIFQVEVIKNNVVRLTREQTNQVNSEVVPMMLAVLERELGEGFI